MNAAPTPILHLVSKRLGLATVVLLVLFPFFSAFATPQVPDILLFEGKEYPIYYQDLMEDYFVRNPDKKPDAGDFVRSNNWRGYIATFKIEQNELFLEDIKVYRGAIKRGEYYYDDFQSILKEVSPKNQKLKVDWYTGLLISAYGENPTDPYSFLTYMNTFERYTLFEINSGNFRRHRDFDNRRFLDFKVKQFKAFKRTPEFKDTLIKLRSNGQDDKRSEEIIRESIILYSKRFLVK